MLTKEEALEALEGCWDGIEEDGIKIQAFINSHFEMVERVKEEVEDVIDSLQILKIIPCLNQVEIIEKVQGRLAKATEEL